MKKKTIYSVDDNCISISVTKKEFYSLKQRLIRLGFKAIYEYISNTYEEYIYKFRDISYNLVRFEVQQC